MIDLDIPDSGCWEEKGVGGWGLDIYGLGGDILDEI
jgi:hypothetical protein